MSIHWNKINFFRQNKNQVFSLLYNIDYLFGRAADLNRQQSKFIGTREISKWETGNRFDSEMVKFSSLCRTDMLELFDMLLIHKGFLSLIARKFHRFNYLPKVSGIIAEQSRAPYCYVLIMFGVPGSNVGKACACFPVVMENKYTPCWLCIFVISNHGTG